MTKRAIYFISSLAVFFFTLGLTTSYAQQLKIGYVEPQTILDRMPEMKAVQQRLQNFAQDKEQEIADQRQAYLDALTEYQQKQSVLSQEARTEQEEALGKMQAELQQAQLDARQALQQRQQELVGPLIDSINNAIEAVAREQGLSYVLNTTTSQGDIIILYASEEAQQQYDITDEVMEKLGI